MTIPSDLRFTARIELQRSDRMGLTRGRGPIAIARATPLWTATLIAGTEQMTGARLGRWRALVDTLEGGVNTINVWDTTIPKPIAYPGALPATRVTDANVPSLLSSFDGRGSIFSVTTTTTITLGCLPAGYVVSPGDAMSFEFASNTRVAYHRITVGGTANANGRAAVTITPALRAGYANNMIIQLLKPTCRMRRANSDVPWSTEAPVMSLSMQLIQVV